MAANDCAMLNYLVFWIIAKRYKECLLQGENKLEPPPSPLFFFLMYLFFSCLITSFYPIWQPFEGWWKMTEGLLLSWELWTHGDCPSTSKCFIMKAHSFKFNFASRLPTFLGGNSLTLLRLQLTVWEQVDRNLMNALLPNMFIPLFLSCLRLYLCHYNLMPPESTCFLLIWWKCRRNNRLLPSQAHPALMEPSPTIRVLCSTTQVLHRAVNPAEGLMVYC